MRSDPIILAFDTSAAHCAAALLRGGRILASRQEAMATGQAERLMPMLEEMLAGAGLAWRDLAGLGVGTGPGNFTGVRIAVSAARGLALALGVPAAGVSMLEAAAEGGPRPLVAVLDARRGEVYAQRFDEAGAGTPCLTGPEAVPALAAGAPLVGPDAARLFPDAATLAPPLPPAEAIARIAAERAHLPGLARPAPLYLRSADAAPPAEAPPVILDA